jgi:beta-barrel assembly-enhancing protease
MLSDWKTTHATAAEWPGRFSDGRSAASRPVSVRFDTDGLRFGDGGGSALWPYADITTAAPLSATSGDVLAMLSSMPGATLFVQDRAFVQQLMKAAPQTDRTAYRKTGLRTAAPVGLLALCIGVSIMTFDLSPSKAIARLMPEAARERLGRSVLTGLPVTETCGNPEGRAALDVLVKRLRPDLKDTPHKVSVLNWDLVNAFAVPGGSVVLTRAILERAASADEIAGVLAHEMGHGIELHAEAGLVRTVGFWALVQMIFTGTPGAIGNVGTVLAQLAYTRSYEREADAIGLKLLRDAKISHKGFAGFFRRMEGSGNKDAGPSRRGPFSADVFETHPPTPERIQTIESQPDYPATPALTDQQWQALKRICQTTPGVGGRIDTTNTGIEAAKPDLARRQKDADAKVAASTTAANYAARADVHAQANRWTEAVADYAKAIELEPDSAYHRYNRGRAYQNAEQYDPALADYAAALRLNPRYSNAQAARGAIARLQNKPEAARRDFDEALSINPRNTYALYQRGLLNAAENRWSESEGDFARAIASNRSHALAHVRRAQALEQLKRRDEAIATYRDALNASPSSPDADTAFKLARDRLAVLGAPERP